MMKSARPELTPAFISHAQAILGDGGFSREASDLSHYGQDWSGILEPAPSAIAFPRTTEQVSALLTLCSEAKIAVVPSGGRTGLSGGACAANGELVISLAKMNKMGEVDVASRTVRVQAGAVTQGVHEHCAAYGLTWPVDFASKGSSQVGGNINTNAGGVRVIHYGNTRNWVLAIEMVAMSGAVFELNGDLEKNNTGYDLRNLIIGSEGTLGIVTAATLKLTPPPKRAQVYLFAVENMNKVIDLFSEARRGPFELLAFECLSALCYRESLKFFKLAPPVGGDSAGVFVLMEIEDNGTDDASEAGEAWLTGLFEKSAVLDGVKAQSPREAETLWKIREGVAESVMAQGAKDAGAGHSVVHQHDVSVPIACLQEFADGIEVQYRRDYPKFEVFIFGHIGDGNLHIFIRRPEGMSTEEFLKQCKASDQALFRFVQKFKGSISAEHGIGVLKKAALPFTRSSLEIEILRGVKHVFDPQGLLNPGKLI